MVGEAPSKSGTSAGLSACMGRHCDGNHSPGWLTDAQAWLTLWVPQPFPPDCPPADAVEAEGTFYRLAQRGHAVGDITTDASWLRPYETRAGELYKRDDVIEAHALSIFSSADELSRARDIAPWMARKSVAVITLSTSDGSLRHAPSAEGDSHHDWWTNPYDLLPTARVIEAAREVAA